MGGAYASRTGTLGYISIGLAVPLSLFDVHGQDAPLYLAQ